MITLKNCRLLVKVRSFLSKNDVGKSISSETPCATREKH